VKAGVILTVPTLLATLTGLACWLHAIHELRWNPWAAVAGIAAALAALATVRGLVKAAKAHGRGRKQAVSGR